MEWIHRCDIRWLRARQFYLTATDVRKLVPFTKTGKPRIVDDETKLKVLAGKLTNLPDDACVSTGAAARGHILEPYAVEEVNAKLQHQHGRFYHWDDCIIAPRGNFHLAFSPDGMTVGQPDDTMLNAQVKAKLLEVKSYGMERHMVAGCTPKDKLEERWQIATAMAADTNIDEALLAFYNPSTTEQLFLAWYSREDLTDEIYQCYKVEEEWQAFVERWMRGDLYHLDFIKGNPTREVEIIAELEKKNRLNP